MVKRRIMPIAMVSLLTTFLFFGCATAPVKESLREGDSGLIVFKSITIDDKLFFGGKDGGSSTKISGWLKFPDKTGILPAVIFTHGAGGVRESERGWAKELNRMGYAVFMLDSFTYRGISGTGTGKQSLGTGSSMIDVFRALELLRTHPRIDPSRIALMGLSRGGRVTLYASMNRFQKKWLSSDAFFVAYIAFYPAIYFDLKGQEDVSGQPIRIFQGLADDWTPVERALAYVDQLRNAGRDVQIFEYPEAHHLFDSPGLPVKFHPNLFNTSKCNFKETTVGGEWLDPNTNERWSFKASCITRGATMGYNPEAYTQAIADVEKFLKTVFRQP